MPQHYRQRIAFLALTKAALRSISKSPSSVIFTIAFPLVFIVVFGFIGGTNAGALQIAVPTEADTQTSFFQDLRRSGLVQIHFLGEETAFEKLRKGALDLQVRWETGDSGRLNLNVLSAPGKEQALKRFEYIARNSVVQQHPDLAQDLRRFLDYRAEQIEGKEFKTIDFILPGQLGFSLLAASVFGTAFVFFNLRQGLVLKRFFATPVRKPTILLAEGVARMIFQLLGAFFILLVGNFFMGYTIIHGLTTVFDVLVLCAIGILVFMSFGFIISGIAKSESTVPPLANILTLPQFLLAGTFFPIDVFPEWMQWVSKALPLTYLNEALRRVAFEGVSLWDVRFEVLILLLWGFIGYFFASRFFRWE